MLIGKVSIHEAIKPALQIIFYVALPVMLLVTFFPELSLFVPRLLGLH
jgi:TRAP-type C4-dicarboxylate transport system permease large subunit